MMNFLKEKELDTKQNQFIQNKLTKHIQENRELGLLVGSGLSRSTPLNLPLWSELVNGFLDEIYRMEHLNSEEIERLQLSSLIDQMTKIVEILGREYILERMLEIFSRPDSFNPEHKLLFDLPLKVILTTNYDKALEYSFQSIFGRIPNVYFGVTHEKLLKALHTKPRHELLIAHLHGVCDMPSTIKVTKQDLDTHYYNNSFVDSTLR